MIYLLETADERCVCAALYRAFTRKETPSAVCCGKCQTVLGEETAEIRGDDGQTDRVRNAVVRYGGQRAADELNILLRAGDEEKCATAFFYLRRLLLEQRNVRDMLALPEVLRFETLLKRIFGEVHRMQGFIRFRRTAGGSYYAPFRPDHDVTELLLPHFALRYGQTNLVLHDVRRNVFGMWNGRQKAVFRSDAPVLLAAEEEEGQIEGLWKTFYKSVSVAERPHEKQMRGYMPARYWEFLPEKKP